MTNKRMRGYTLIELIVAVGLFALIMMLASGAYLMMIGINRQVQATATGINNLSFALETMTRTIRTGSNYSCSNGSGNNDCTDSTKFTFTDSNGVANVTYMLDTQPGPNGPVGDITKDGAILTDPSVNITDLSFNVFGSKTTQQNDYQQARMTIIVSGTVPYAAGKSETFKVETGATMRGPDI